MLAHSLGVVPLSLAHSLGMVPLSFMLKIDQIRLPVLVATRYQFGLLKVLIC